MDNFQKVKDLISASSLPFSDQIDLIDLFSKGNDSELELIVELFTENQIWIEKISHNYKWKLKALKTKDAEVWKKIVEEEKKELEEIEKYNSTL